MCYTINLHILAIFLLIAFITLNYLIMKRINSTVLNEHFFNMDVDNNTIEGMDDNESTNKYIDQQINAKMEKVQSMINSSQLTGPAGPRGPQGSQGPAGNKIVASGYLVNAGGSYESGIEKSNIFTPDYVITRTAGTTPEMSLSYLDKPTSFVSYQNWMLTEDNFLINRYDNTCMTINDIDNKVYMAECNNSVPQQWTLDKNNRIVSLNKGKSNETKCLGLSKEENNITTTNLPDCNDSSCYNNKAKKFVVVKNCNTEKISPNEIWNFI